MPRRLALRKKQSSQWIQDRGVQRWSVFLQPHSNLALTRWTPSLKSWTSPSLFRWRQPTIKPSFMILGSHKTPAGVPLPTHTHTHKHTYVCTWQTHAHPHRHPCAPHCLPFTHFNGLLLHPDYAYSLSSTGFEITWMFELLFLDFYVSQFRAITKKAKGLWDWQARLVATSSQFKEQAEFRWGGHWKNPQNTVKTTAPSHKWWSLTPFSGRKIAEEKKN